MPCSRHSSGTGVPVSACLSTARTWLSVKRNFLMEPPRVKKIPLLASANWRGNYSGRGLRAIPLHLRHVRFSRPQVVSLQLLFDGHGDQPRQRLVWTPSDLPWAKQGVAGCDRERVTRYDFSESHPFGATFFAYPVGGWSPFRIVAWTGLLKQNAEYETALPPFFRVLILGLEIEDKHMLEHRLEAGVG